MKPDKLYRRYQELQRYVGWTEEDAGRIRAAAPLLEPHLAGLVVDFYAEIEKHERAHRVITGGAVQIERLKGTLLAWLHELLGGVYDPAYVVRRWRVGWRHVEIGLDQVYANVALARLRSGLVRILSEAWTGNPADLSATIRSLQVVTDLDLAIIEDAYQAEHLARQRHSERLANQVKRRRLALAKARSEAALNTLIQTVPCIILILRPDHTLLYLNPFAVVITGYQAEELLGRDGVETLLPAEARPAVADAVSSALAGATIRGLDCPLLCKDGTLRWLVWNARVLPDYEGGPAVVAVGQDVTRMKEAQEQALQSARLAAIGQMMMGLAHESRNALQRSQACLEMLTLAVEDRPQALDLVGRVQRAQDRLHRLFEDVRGYAGSIHLERRLCSLADVWQEAWGHLSAQHAERDARLEEAACDISLYCEADPFALEQVFRNILDNALAATPDPVAHSHPLP